MEKTEFKVIVFTAPYNVYKEAEKWQTLLDAGVDYIHVRKPGSDESQVRDLLGQIPLGYRSKLVLHDWYHLAVECSLGGIHLNARNNEFWFGGGELVKLLRVRPDLRLSRSVHSLKELDAASCEFAYCTLSPIFDSISKPGYKALSGIDAISDGIYGRRVVALGGVTPDCFDFLYEKNFCGAALLGYIWEGDFVPACHILADAVKRFK